VLLKTNQGGPTCEEATTSLNRKIRGTGKKNRGGGGRRRAAKPGSGSRRPRPGGVWLVVFHVGETTRPPNTKKRKGLSARGGHLGGRYEVRARRRVEVRFRHPPGRAGGTEGLRASLIPKLRHPVFAWLRRCPWESGATPWLGCFCRPERRILSAETVLFEKEDPSISFPRTGSAIISRWGSRRSRSGPARGWGGPARVADGSTAPPRTGGFSRCSVWVCGGRQTGLVRSERRCGG